MDDLKKQAMKTREKEMNDLITWDDKTSKEKAEHFERLIDQYNRIESISMYIACLESNAFYWKQYALELEKKLDKSE